MKIKLFVLLILCIFAIGILRADANVYVYETPSSNSAFLNTNTNINTNRIVTYSPSTRIITKDNNSEFLNPIYTYNFVNTRDPIRIHRYNPYGEHVVGYDYDSDGRVKAIRTITNYNPPIYRPMYHQQPVNYGYGIPNYMGMPHNMPNMNNMNNMQRATGTINWKL